MNILSRIGRLGLGIIAFLAGSVFGCDNAPAYGIEGNLQPHDPDLTLVDFSYTPANTVSPGDTLEFTATTSKPTNAAGMTVTVGDPLEFIVLLNDVGIAPDDVPNDGIWKGEHQIDQNTSPQEDMPVDVKFYLNDGFPVQKLAGEDLTIIDGDV